nr:hypothetical protein OG999_38220 [Streptomyces sp. NBC_00886]
MSAGLFRTAPRTTALEAGASVPRVCLRRVSTAGGGARLAVLATSQVDVGNVGYEMTMVVRQVGQFLSAAPRFPEYSGAPFAGEHE